MIEIIRIASDNNFMESRFRTLKIELERVQSAAERDKDIADLALIVYTAILMFGTPQVCGQKYPNSAHDSFPLGRRS